MIRNLSATLTNPMSAAIFAAVVTLIGRYVDHRISRKPDNLVDYLKAMAFNGALVFFIVNSITGGRRGGQTVMNMAF